MSGESLEPRSCENAAQRADEGCEAAMRIGPATDDTAFRYEDAKDLLEHVRDVTRSGPIFPSSSRPAPNGMPQALIDRYWEWTSACPCSGPRPSRAARRETAEERAARLEAQLRE